MFAYPATLGQDRILLSIKMTGFKRWLIEDNAKNMKIK